MKNKSVKKQPAKRRFRLYGKSLAALESACARVGLEVADQNSSQFRCRECGGTWSVSVGRGGRFPRGWWVCPGRCNEYEK